MTKLEELKAIATAPQANRFFPNSEISAIENCSDPDRLEKLAADPAHGNKVEPKGLHEAVIGLAQGIHARPAAVLTSVAKQFDGDVALIAHGRRVNAKSVAALSAGTLDTLPHNGGVVSLLAVCGSTHRQSYFDIAIVGIVGPALALAAVIILGSVLGAF